MGLSFAARELIKGLWCEADDRGVFEWKPGTIKARIMPADAVNVSDLLAELEKARFIAPFTVGERQFGAIRNFCKYQKPKKPTYPQPLPKSLYGWVAFSPTDTGSVDDVDGSGGEAVGNSGGSAGGAVPLGVGVGVGEKKEPIPPPAETSRPAGEPKPADRPMAAAVARHFLEQREKHWPNTSRLPAPLTTITTQAQQHIDAGGTVDLLNEVIDRGFATWAKPTPPQSLLAFGDSLTDRVAEFVCAGKQPAPRAASPQHRRDTGPAEHIVVDMQSTLRQRLKTFRDKGEWFWPGEPRPDNPRCPIDRKLMREVMGDEFMARWHPQVASVGHGGTA
ncbi:hypothetical protein FZ983_32180 [Azospirillum sp. B21]|uniref:hypothetical protein n=1 Tax=Azospirillum sp. B21 TaxID=2607496 RepID=UPI0011EECB49|nr:hypothetical protein [Azospirillum sp. B21]KAA0572230.1 hypothetical protein FZ983_32180 [Azospirillum sp. B21]